MILAIATMSRMLIPILAAIMVTAITRINTNSDNSNEQMRSRDHNTLNGNDNNNLHDTSRVMTTVLTHISTCV